MSDAPSGLGGIFGGGTTSGPAPNPEIKQVSDLALTAVSALNDSFARVASYRTLDANYNGTEFSQNQDIMHLKATLENAINAEQTYRNELLVIFGTLHNISTQLKEQAKSDIPVPALPAVPVLSL